jgi:hypothetical protein
MTLVRAKGIQYIKGKHVLDGSYSISIPELHNNNCKNGKYLSISKDGFLMISKGYSWDGASGPAIDTETIMRGSLVHDALYELMGERILDRSLRKKVDKVFYKICREDGMSWFRAKYVYWTVRRAGKFFV